MRKLKGWIAVLLLSLTLFGLTACNEDSADSAPSYEQITAEQARELMDTETDVVIIDARTQEEYDAGHIEGAVMIPEYEITNRAETALPNKDQLILVYCRSGRRSKIASEALVSIGYTNVKEFGGIIDWPYEIVQ